MGPTSDLPIHVLMPGILQAAQQLGVSPSSGKG